MRLPRPSRSAPALLALLLAAGQAAAQDAAYADVVARAAGMTGDAEARALAARHGLQVLNVTWEDTGRTKGSSVGPNISDLTIQVQAADGRRGPTAACMPVIRFPNFEDTTADLSLDRFQVLVGNERGQPLRRVSLRELLANLRRYLTTPTSWTGTKRSLLAERDTHALVSAQACFLPVPKAGAAEFTPVLFNYQSQPGDPAVLAILVSREGTSVTVIDNARDRAAAAWGQQLFFNHAGQRARFTGQRLSDFQASGQGAATNGAAVVKDDPAGGLNQVILIQVPLKTRPRPERALAADCAGAAPCAPPGAAAERARHSDVEEAVVGHGEVEGPFAEVCDLPIERDERFPIRVTVQFYKATSNGVVSPADVETIARQLKAVYAQGDAVGSLVTTGDTGRPTEHQGPATTAPAFWADFWARRGGAAAPAQRTLRDAFGADWTPRTPEELEAALRLVEALGQDRATSSAPPDRVLDGCGTAARAHPCGTGRAQERSRLLAEALAGVAALAVAGVAALRVLG